jgi:hypothetical protein
MSITSFSGADRAANRNELKDGWPKMRDQNQRFERGVQRSRGTDAFLGDLLRHSPFGSPIPPLR